MPLALQIVRAWGEGKQARLKPRTRSPTHTAGRVFLSHESGSDVGAWVASQSCCNFAAASVPFAVSLGGCHLLPFGL
jgi:hypothetical protein